MVKKLVTRSEFARIAGVSPTAITKACKGPLAAAVDGKFVDPEHTDALAYLEKLQGRDDGPPAALGLDPLYEKALALALEWGRPKVRGFKEAFRIDTPRAQKLVKLVEASGLVAQNEVQKTRETIHVHLGTPPPKVTRGIYVPPKADAPTEYDELPSPSEYPGQTIEDLVDLTLRELIAKFGTADRFRDWLLARKSLVDIGAKEIANAEKRGLLIPREFVERHVIATFTRVHINLMTDGAQNIARRMYSMVQAGDPVEECETFVSEQISRHVREAKDSIERVLKDV